MHSPRSLNKFLVALSLVLPFGILLTMSLPAHTATIGRKIASILDGDIVAWAMSPDGTTIVYSGWENLTGGDPNLALFSVNIDGGDSTKLVELVSSCCNEWKIDPISTNVLYLDQLPGGFSNENALFSVPIDGGNPTQVSEDGYTVFKFELTPDGNRVIFTSASYALGFVINLYSAVIGGGSPQQLNSGATIPKGGNVSSFALSNASGGNWRAVYMGDQRFDNVVELFSVPVIAGTPPVRLNPDLVSGGDVHNFWVTPDGQRVAYLADQETDEVRELYSVLVGGSGGVKLNGSPPPGENFPAGFLSFAPSSTKVLYLMNDGNGVGNLYSVTVAGEFRTELTDDFFKDKVLWGSYYFQQSAGRLQR